MSIEVIAERFKVFAKRECKGSSELYEFLSKKISEDNELLELSSCAKEGQPIPNLFLGAIHYLLLKGTNHELKEYYPSLVVYPRDIHHAILPFKDFCNMYRNEIISILTTKLVQTNEVSRCGYLYPSFSYIYSKVKKPLALIEIGTSAGLQLLWDKYNYSYDSHEVFENIKSNLFIQSEVRGNNKPHFLQPFPPVTSRYGIDLHTVDVANPDDSLWLQALIWPEHKERRERFKQAVACMNQYSDQVHLIEGDGVMLLPQIVQQIPQDSAVCIYHTHVANQIPDKVKHSLTEHVRKIGSLRDTFHLYNNMWDRDLHLDSIIDGIEYNERIGETDGHGRWFTWEPSETV